MNILIDCIQHSSLFAWDFKVSRVPLPLLRIFEERCTNRSPTWNIKPNLTSVYYCVLSPWNESTDLKSIIQLSFLSCDTATIFNSCPFYLWPWRAGLNSDSSPPVGASLQLFWAFAIDWWMDWWWGLTRLGRLMLRVWLYWWIWRGLSVNVAWIIGIHIISVPNGAPSSN